MKLAIVGSTTFPGLRSVSMARSLIEVFLFDYEPELLISGGADGVDTWAEEAADRLGIPKRIHRPKNRRWEPEGYKERNLLIAQDCTHLLRIVRRDSTTYGSGWTADQATKMGKTVWQVFL